MMTLTKQQRQAYDFIRSFQAQNGYGPTYADMCAHLGMASRSGPNRIVHELVARRTLRKPAQRGRCYELFGEEDAALHLRQLLSALQSGDAGKIKAKSDAAKAYLAASMSAGGSS